MWNLQNKPPNLKIEPISVSCSEPPSRRASCSGIFELKRADKEDAVRLIVKTFAWDPLFVALFGKPKRRTRSSAAAAHAFVSAIYDMTSISGGAPSGFFDNGRLVAVTLVKPPQSTKWRFVLTWLGTLLRTLPLVGALGPSRLLLLNSYSTSCQKEQPHERIHYLMIIAVQPDWQGQGIGRLLLQEIFRSVDEHPLSLGLGLDTEDRENVGLYQHLGFELKNELRFAEFTAYCMYRSRSRTV